MIATRHIYLIKDLARMTGLSIYTIKYYLNLGLIREIGRSPETNFRYFDDSTVEDVNKIRSLKKKNMNLSGISEILKAERA